MTIDPIAAVLGKKSPEKKKPVVSRNHQFHAARAGGGNQSFSCPKSLWLSPASSGRDRLSQRQPQLNLSHGFSLLSPKRKPPLPWALPMETEPFQLLVGFWPLPEAPLHILGLGMTKIPALDGNPISGLKIKPSLGLQTKPLQGLRVSAPCWCGFKQGLTPGSPGGIPGLGPAEPGVSAG